MELCLMALLIASFLLTLSFMLSLKWQWNQEKFSPYECGFSSFSPRRSTFSLQFFLVALIFLIFDAEIIFLFSFIFLHHLSFWSSISILFIMSIIFYGLVHEWKMGSLDWMI